jgi:hypothetical protein
MHNGPLVNVTFELLRTRISCVEQEYGREYGGEADFSSHIERLLVLTISKKWANSD